MIKIEEVISIHDILLDKFGGIHGIRDNIGNADGIGHPRPTQIDHLKE